MPYRYTDELRHDVLFRAGEPTDGTSEYHARVLDYLNRVYLAVCQGGQEFGLDVNEDWLWLRQSASVILVPPITMTGTVTKGSSAVTLSAAPVDDLGVQVSLADDWFLTMTDRRDWVQVVSHTAGGTSATLASSWIHDSGTVPLLAGKLQMTLPNMLRLAGPLMLYDARAWPRQRRTIPVVPVEQFLVPSVLSSSPTMATFRATNRLQIDHPPSKRLRLEYEYLTEPAVLMGGMSEEPLVPLKDRRILADGALAYLLLDKNDDRADALLMTVGVQVRAMANENRAVRARTDSTLGRYIRIRAGDLRTKLGRYSEYW